MKASLSRQSSGEMHLKSLYKKSFIDKDVSLKKGNLYIF